MTSRRNFLRNGTMGAIAAGLTYAVSEKVKASAADPASSDLEILTMGDFASQLRTTFLIKNGTREVPLKLIEVKDLGSSKKEKHREAFSLVLKGATATPLKQETYSIKHEELGNFSMLMVPLFTRDESARYYEININRLHG